MSLAGVSRHELPRQPDILQLAMYVRRIRGDVATNPRWSLPGVSPSMGNIRPALKRWAGGVPCAWGEIALWVARPVNCIVLPRLLVSDIR